jgi:hypothetical protein
VNPVLVGSVYPLDQVGSSLIGVDPVNPVLVWPVSNVENVQICNYLVTLYSPDLKHPTVYLDQVKLVLFVEDCTSVWTGIICQVQARRVWLRNEVSHISQ